MIQDQTLVDSVENLEMALGLIRTLEDLIENLDYHQYLHKHLTFTKVELERQLTNEKFKLKHAA